MRPELTTVGSFCLFDRFTAIDLSLKDNLSEEKVELTLASDDTLNKSSLTEFEGNIN